MSKQCVACGILLGVGLLGCGPSYAQDGTASTYPTRPIRWIVPSSAGGGNDTLARLFGAKMTESWGQQIVVDLRPGASGIIGTELAARAAPDGYTLLITASGYILNTHLKKSLPYDSLRDLQRVTILTFSPNVLVAHPSTPFRTLGDLIGYAKKNPGDVNYASSGPGTIGSLAAKMFAQYGRVKLVEIPYKGAGDAGRAVSAGEVHINLNAPSVVIPFIKAGRLRGLGVTSPKRMDVLPDVPAIAEVLPGYELQNFFGLLVPAKTPRPIVDKLHREMVRILALPDVRKRLEDLGFIPAGTTPDEFTAYFHTTSEKWGALIKDAGLTAR